MKIKYDIKLSLVLDKTISEIWDIDAIVSKKGHYAAGVDTDTSIAAMYAARDLRRYRFTPAGRSISLRQFYGIRKTVDEDYIHIHRLNYMVYTVVQDMHDWIEDEHLKTFNTERYWRMIERTFTDYQHKHRALMEKAAWNTVQDHVRLATNEVYPLVEPFENAIRDYLIQKRVKMVAAGQKDDITLLKKVYVCLMFIAALRNTRRNFFDDFGQKYGIDFTSDFAYSDISSISRNYVCMMQQLGVRFTLDKDGDSVLLGADPSENSRVNNAWSDIVDVVTNGKLMDKVALDAINMNPESKAEYESLIAKADEKELNERIGDLSSKFKVNKL